MRKSGPTVQPVATSVLVKATPPGTYLIYFAGSKTPLGNLALQGVADGGCYHATWFDPRTGEKTAIEPRRAAGEGLQLPVPPDGRDWMLILRQQEAPEQR